MNKQTLLDAIQEARDKGANLPNPVSHDDGVRTCRILTLMGIDHNMVGTPIWNEWLIEAFPEPQPEELD